MSTSEFVNMISDEERSQFGERMLPELTDANRPFWTSGGTGQWSLPWCSECSLYIHPGQPRCPRCLNDSLAPRPVSGRGSVFTFTVSNYQWLPGWATPYVAAIIELDDQAGLRVTSNLVGVEAADVRIGMPVEVTFSQQGEYWVPLFRPAASA
jgi:uncharacterized OB-fold protein